jgi:hypothetical protein
MDLGRHELFVCKKWYKNNLKMRLMALLFDPPRRAPHPYDILSEHSLSIVGTNSSEGLMWPSG